MTRAEHYCAGRAEGERWAEAELRTGRSVHYDTLGTLSTSARVAMEYRRLQITGDANAAFLLGRCRGYRDTLHRWETGALTWEMLG